MASIVERLIATHPDKQFVYPTTKQDVLVALDELRHVIEAMDDFAQFPEGANGAVIYALLKRASSTSPDAGDFNYLHQGCQAAMRTAFEVLSASVLYPPSSS